MAFGNCRAQFKAKSQLSVRKLLYGRRGLSHTPALSLSHMTCGAADGAAGTRGGGELHVIGETVIEMLDHVSARPVSSHPHLPALN
jgi:hypothetical protein